MTAPPALDRTARRGPLHLLAVFYAVVAGLALWGQSDALMLWLHAERPVAVFIAAGIELLAAVLFAFADWRRAHHGEQALAAQAFSAVVAAAVAGMNYAGHPGSLGQRLVFTFASLAGYGVIVLHTNARRRDLLRATGRLAVQPPTYGLGQWLLSPRITWYARLLATNLPEMGRRESLVAAYTDLKTTRQHKAIERALRRKLSRALPAVSADVAMVSYDLRKVAAGLAASVDYDQLTALLADDIHPDRIAARHKPVPAKPSGPVVVRVDDADKPQPKPSSSTRRTKVARPDAAARVREALAAHPNGTQADIARAAGTSDRTVRRVLSAARADIDAIAVPAH